MNVLQEKAVLSPVTDYILLTGSTSGSKRAGSPIYSLYSLEL